MEKSLPLLTLRPQFDQALTMVYALIAGAIGTLLATIIGGVFIYVLLMLLGLARFAPIGYVFGLILVCSLVAIPALYFEARKKSLQRTIFNFHGDHVEYQYFYWHLGRRRGRLFYKDITDVSQRASVLQEQRGLTTIYLYVPGLEYRQKGFPGLAILDVPQPRDDLTKIMQIMDNWRRAMMTPLPASPPPAAETQALPLENIPPASKPVSDDSPSLL